VRDSDGVGKEATARMGPRHQKLGRSPALITHAGIIYSFLHGLASSAFLMARPALAKSTRDPP
jgi:hypothetical protein